MRMLMLLSMTDTNTKDEAAKEADTKVVESVEDARKAHAEAADEHLKASDDQDATQEDSL